MIRGLPALAQGERQERFCAGSSFRGKRRGGRGARGHGAAGAGGGGRGAAGAGDEGALPAGHLPAGTGRSERLGLHGDTRLGRRCPGTPPQRALLAQAKLRVWLCVFPERCPDPLRGMGV